MVHDNCSAPHPNLPVGPIFQTPVVSIGEVKDSGKILVLLEESAGIASCFSPVLPTAHSLTHTHSVCAHAQGDRCLRILCEGLPHGIYYSKKFFGTSQPFPPCLSFPIFLISNYFFLDSRSLRPCLRSFHPLSSLTFS